MSPEETTVQVLILWALALSTVINLGTVVWNIFSGPSKKNGARLDALTAEMSAQGQRLTLMEQSHRSLPSKDDMHELEMSMERLKGEMKTMSQVMAGHGAIMERVEAIVARHEDHLLKKT